MSQAITIEKTTVKAQSLANTYVCNYVGRMK